MLLQDHDQVMKQRDVPVGDRCVRGGGDETRQSVMGGKTKKGLERCSAVTGLSALPEDLSLVLSIHNACNFSAREFSVLCCSHGQLGHTHHPTLK